jgi:hypothetical protein
LTAKGNTHRLSQEGNTEITGNTIMDLGKRSTRPIPGIISAAGAASVTLGKSFSWISRVLKPTTCFGSLGFVTKITGALTVLLWGTFVLRDIDIVDVTFGTMKDGAKGEPWLLIVIIGGCEVADDWKLVDTGVILGMKSPFRVSVCIEVVLLVERDEEFWNGDRGVEDPPVESRSKEELPFVVLFAVKWVSIPGLKDREMA